MAKDFFRDQLARILPALAGRRIVKNAMTPILWLCGLSSSCFLTAYGFRDNLALSTALTITGILPFLVACFLAVYFALCEPDRLHSEDYRLRARILEITERKGGKIQIDPMDLIDVTNPYPEPKSIKAEQSPGQLPHTLGPDGGHDE